MFIIAVEFVFGLFTALSQLFLPPGYNKHVLRESKSPLLQVRVFYPPQ